jgi:hypothetical protein
MRILLAVGPLVSCTGALVPSAPTYERCEMRVPVFQSALALVKTTARPSGDGSG